MAFGFYNDCVNIGPILPPSTRPRVVYIGHFDGYLIAWFSVLGRFVTLCTIYESTSAF